ncbi:MAG TPA: hypothetical protein VNQ90_05420 [Chthoniobacteraceae bacterium]|nr:hypothetical protein [Chthoniobacteraceae bacterium]
MPQPKKARGGFPYLWAVAGFCLVGILALVIRWAPGTEAYDRKVREDRLATLEEVKKAAEEKLAGYRWVDQEKKVVGLPIERAMELTVGELKDRTVGPSEVKAVSTGSMIVPPYLKAAAPAAEAPAAEGAAEPQTEAAPASAATESTTPEPAAETTPEAAPPAETPAATPAPAADEAPAASPSPSAEPAAPEAAAPSQPAATGEGTPDAAQTPSAD